MRVDFPEPVLPMSPIKSPSFTVILTLSKAFFLFPESPPLLPYSYVTLFKTIFMDFTFSVLHCLLLLCLYLLCFALLTAALPLSSLFRTAYCCFAFTFMISATSSSLVKISAGSSIPSSLNATASLVT